jgi:hypothetical protein
LQTMNSEMPSKCNVLKNEVIRLKSYSLKSNFIQIIFKKKTVPTLQET